MKILNSYFSIIVLVMAPKVSSRAADLVVVNPVFFKTDTPVSTISSNALTYNANITTTDGGAAYDNAAGDVVVAPKNLGGFASWYNHAYFANFGYNTGGPFSGGTSEIYNGTDYSALKSPAKLAIWNYDYSDPDITLNYSLKSGTSTTHIQLGSYGPTLTSVDLSSDAKKNGADLGSITVAGTAVVYYSSAAVRTDFSVATESINPELNITSSSYQSQAVKDNEGQPYLYAEKTLQTSYNDLKNTQDALIAKKASGPSLSPDESKELANLNSQLPTVKNFIDNDSITIQKEGCVLTAWAMAASIVGKSISNVQLDQLLDDNNGYTQVELPQLIKPNDVKGLTVKDTVVQKTEQLTVNRPNSEADIVQAIASGHAVILRVNEGKHSVVAYGASLNSNGKIVYDVFDPGHSGLANNGHTAGRESGGIYDGNTLAGMGVDLSAGGNYIVGNEATNTSSEALASRFLVNCPVEIKFKGPNGQYVDFDTISGLKASNWDGIDLRAILPDDDRGDDNSTYLARELWFPDGGLALGDYSIEVTGLDSGKFDLSLMAYAISGKALFSDWDSDIGAGETVNFGFTVSADGLLTSPPDGGVTGPPDGGVTSPPNGGSAVPEPTSYAVFASMGTIGLMLRRNMLRQKPGKVISQRSLDA